MERTISLSQKISLQPWVPFLLIASVFSVPLSSTAKSIFLVLSIAFILLIPAYRSHLGKIFSETWCKAAVLFFALAFVGCLWSPATNSEKLLIIEKYSKLLYLPILVVAFRESSVRMAALHAFILAILINCLVSILARYGLFNINPDYVFRNHIMMGLMTSFAVYLSLLFFSRQTDPKLRLAYLGLAAILSYQLFFINAGRTGYIVYFLLMSLLLMQMFSFRQKIIGILLLVGIFTLGYLESPIMQKRVSATAQELADYQQNKLNTSIGYRLQFHRYARKLFEQHPIWGNGSGSFNYYFRTENPVPSWGPRLLEPHSQYWLIAAEFGLLGITALLFLFFQLFKISLSLKSLKPVAVAVLMLFIVGNLSDSLLLYSGSGYFFILLLAICFGEKEESRVLCQFRGNC